MDSYQFTKETDTQKQEQLGPPWLALPEITAGWHSLNFPPWNFLQETKPN